MPPLGLGVFQTPPEETSGAVEAALAAGYRHIDTAAAYGNEREVGEAIRRSGIDRGEVFIKTKLWISDYGYDEALLGVRGAPAPPRARATSTCILLTSRCRASSSGPSRRTRRSKSCSPTAGRARSASATSARALLESLMAQMEVVPAVNQIEAAPVLHAAAAARAPCPARHPDPGVVADRRHHVYRAATRRGEEPARAPDDPRDRRRSTASRRRR